MMEAVNKELSFEEGIEHLERIVRELEQKEVPLEQALNLFRQGIELVQKCNNQLDYAEKQMQILLENPNGELEVRPADFPVEG
ncbi:exodeoxyribonuclease VII small subunit [Desulfitobacterium sp. LBE]|uniref:Exodeoxyribonuclease 7 small subunit n=6 Tax=root TaxID=1 RepID=A0A098B234_DESHA|nr:exodeoxyribonuclease VII, small subunit [Desulfitobacterium hafniense DCB-2]EHL07586.1 exodeoxyribonuclease VII, small subunit [Desulfitobacterium hafniense DP7]TWH60703.1 exodeoxyribonuclease VII small subunit [Desulfitobacterium sp. LBE]CDX02430.1 Exodeoxyribonuclease 7 small subunit [Desulfitobacterium hafniense]SHN78449.1 Exodeoxyribonuclease VII small subunit [Desulfitobacterium chlororespirans DSM 11544]